MGYPVFRLQNGSTQNLWAISSDDEVFTHGEGTDRVYGLISGVGGG